MCLYMYIVKCICILNTVVINWARTQPGLKIPNLIDPALYNAAIYNDTHLKIETSQAQHQINLTYS